MKKILLYIDMLDRTGAQRVLANLAVHFSNIGMDVVFVNDFPRKEGSHQFILPLEIKRVYLKDNNQGNALIKNVVRIGRLRTVIRKEKPDVVLSFMGRPNLRMLVATLGMRKIKKCVSVRNDPNKEYGRSGLRKKLTNFLFGFADGCVFQTKDATKYFRQDLVRRSRIILNPVNNLFYEQQRSDKPKDIVTFGRLEPQKNHRLLLRSFAAIADQTVDNLYIYGEGPLRQALTEEAKVLGIEQRVFFPGNIADVEKKLAEAKLFVLSSDYEGLPNALMEAIAVGVPVISTNCPCGGPKMLIRSEREGMLIPCGDEKCLAEAMKEILVNESLQQDMSFNEKARAEEYRGSVIYRQWEEYLNSL